MIGSGDHLSTHANGDINGVYISALTSIGTGTRRAAWNISSSCLEHLFELPEQVELHTAATISVDTGKSDVWNVFTMTRLPKQMKVAYKSATGETKYKTFVSCPSSEDVTSTGEFQ